MKIWFVDARKNRIVQRGGRKMNEVMEKTLDFLMELRGGNIHRETLVHLDECKERKAELKQLEPAFKEIQASCTKEQQELIEKYFDLYELLNSAEQQEAYCQGMIDAVQILAGLHLLKE